MQDILRDLGHLTLGSRLKRLGERLQAQTQTMLESAGIEVPASHCPALAALGRYGPLTVGDLALTLGVSQPGVTRMLGMLETQRLVRSTPSASDRRLRTLSLTAAGERLVENAGRTSWPLIESAVADACAEPNGPLLAQLDALEDALAAAPLAMRSARLRPTIPAVPASTGNASQKPPRRRAAKA